MKHHIFDLDHTVIDSSHRQRLKPCGDLDLEHWIANRANAKLVMADKLLPFASFMRAVAKVQPVAICTSRVISPLEYRYLSTHDLPFEYFLHRQENDSTPDAPYKVKQIRKLLDFTGWEASETTLYDDHAGVRAAVKAELGLQVFDPVPFNKKALSAVY